MEQRDVCACVAVVCVMFQIPGEMGTFSLSTQTLMNVLQGLMAVLVALVDAETLLAPTRATVTQATDLLMDGLVLVRSRSLCLEDCLSL